MALHSDAMCGRWYMKRTREPKEANMTETTEKIIHTVRLYQQQGSLAKFGAILSVCPSTVRVLLTKAE